jgi:glucuronoarabinoxylan endo-1,4-beta-xylanase
MISAKPSSLIASSLIPSGLIPSLLATLFILGCGRASTEFSTTTAATTGSSLSGTVKGGQQPISGATIQLYQVGTTGDGSSATGLGSSTTTGLSGTFSISGDYTCPGANTQVYLLATGGNPGLASGTNNTAIELIAALGPCGSLSPSININLNEVTTVAAVAALSKYMASPTSIGSGTQDAPALATAFALASQYVSTSTGTPPGTSAPTGDTVPTALIDTLGDIVAPCVNSMGGSAGDGSSCGMLFTDSTPSGGTAPANIAVALLNILNNPANDLASLFSLVSSTAPFEPVLNLAPASWTVSLLTTPTITWATPFDVVQGTALTSVQLDAAANVPGVFAYSPALGTVMNTAGNITLSAIFTPTDTTDDATASGTVSLIVVPSAGTAVVDFGTPEQTIRGFGASEVFFGVLPSAQITALYGQSSGQVGLSIMRIQIAPTTWTSSTQTAAAGAWTAELTNGKAAQALGATIFASPWTPPASMKTNNNTNEGSLSTSSYSDYANYLKAYVNYAVSMGVNLYAVSMQNEPDWNPCVVNGVDQGPTGASCYVSCLWTAAQMDTWVAGYGSVLTTGANPVKLIMPESFYFSSAMSDPALNDSAAVGNISIVGGHLYGSAPYYYTNAKSKGKDVWMTEHFLTPVSNGPTTSIADAIAAATEIHNSMTVGQYNAYVWWEGPNTTTPAVQEHLVDVNNKPTYFGYALAQFSRFVRPGYVRYNATATPVTGVNVSAYGGGGHQVIVAINSTSSQVTLPILVESQAVTSMTPYQTTSSVSVSQLSAIAVTNNEFTVTLPAQSITTYVQ